MSAKYVFHPPSGEEYGFPKALPDEAVIHYGNNDYGAKKDFDVIAWMISEGYPQEKVDFYGEKFMWASWVLKEQETNND